MMAPAGAAEAERIKLSRSAVVDRALQLADAEGVEAVTIRRLAQEQFGADLFIAGVLAMAPGGS